MQILKKNYKGKDRLCGVPRQTDLLNWNNIFSTSQTIETMDCDVFSKWIVQTKSQLKITPAWLNLLREF